MAEEKISREHVIEATETALRRFGLAKISVVDVAKALKVSHGVLYRHFDGKADMVDAAIERWLDRLAGPLAVIAAEQGPAPERMRRWFDVLIASQAAKAQNDPELFDAFRELARRGGHAIDVEVERRAAHLAKMLDDGMAQGAFESADAGTTARAILDATAPFWRPEHAAEWRRPQAQARFDAVFRLVLRGLSAR